MEKHFITARGKNLPGNLQLPTEPCHSCHPNFQLTFSNSQLRSCHHNRPWIVIDGDISKDCNIWQNNKSRWFGQGIKQWALWHAHQGEVYDFFSPEFRRHLALQLNLLCNFTLLKDAKNWETFVYTQKRKILKGNDFFFTQFLYFWLNFKQLINSSY